MPAAYLRSVLVWVHQQPRAHVCLQHYVIRVFGVRSVVWLGLYRVLFRATFASLLTKTWVNENIDWKTTVIKLVYF